MFAAKRGRTLVNEPHNPYAPPKAAVTPYEERREVEPVGKGVRFGEFLVDYVSFILFSVLLGALVFVVFGEAGVTALERVPDIVLGIVTMFAFYAFFEGLWARSPGKWAFGTAVVNEDGLQPSFGTISLRTVCRFIPFDAFSYLGDRGWHDSISKTFVIKVRGK
jgi:uncharacterized RDD family membrane protein YckC